MIRTDVSSSRDYAKMERRLTILVKNVSLAFVKDRQTYSENCRQINEGWKEAKAISSILRDIKSGISFPSRKEESMNRMLVYLGLVESLGNTLMDMFIMVLIMNGREIHTRSGSNVKHVRLMKELKDTTLDGKLDFLDDEGFGFFKRFIDKNTRSIIAHLKFTIENNGDVKQKD